jgi:hypothetical protein
LDPGRRIGLLRPSSIDARLPMRASDAVHLATPNTWIEIAPLGVSSAAGTTDGPLLAFEAAAPGLDLVYAATPDSVEELRVARTIEAARTSRWSVRLGPALSQLRVREGYVEAVDANGTVQLVASPLFAVDANGVRRELRARVERGTTWTLEAALDVEGLIAPIVIDPLWSTTPSMKTGRTRPWVGSVNGKVVVGGGSDASGAPVLTVEVFDAATSTWSEAGLCRWSTSGGNGGDSTSTFVPISSTKAQIYDYWLRCLYDDAASPKTIYGAGTIPTLSNAQGAFAPGANRAVVWDLNGVYRFVPGSVTDNGSPIAIPGYPCYAQSEATAVTVDDRVGTFGSAPTVERVWMIGGKVSGSPIAEISRFDPVAGNCSYPQMFLKYKRLRPSIARVGTQIFVVGGGVDDATMVEVFDTAKPSLGPSSASTFQSQLVSPSPYPLTFPFTFAPVKSGTKTYWLAVKGAHVMAFDPAGATRWHAFPDLAAARVETTGAAVADGRVLVPAGFVTGVGTVATAELFKYPSVGDACAVDAECGFDRLCVDGKCCEGCAAKKKLGESCAAAAECGSAQCVDGVCCNNACNAQCAACDVEGSKGTCTPIVGAPRGGRAACAGASTPCAGTCDGVYVLTCAYPGPAESCGATCEDGRAVTSVCDGKGACKAQTPISCGGYACESGACKAKCTSDTQCATGYRCQGDACVPATIGTCSDDLAVATSLDDRTRACAPFKCDPSLGACREICNTSDDCLAGNVCAPTKACVSATGGSDESGGGCSIAAPRVRFDTIALLALVASALVARKAMVRPSA